MVPARASGSTWSRICTRSSRISTSFWPSLRYRSSEGLCWPWGSRKDTLLAFGAFPNCIIPFMIPQTWQKAEVLSGCWAYPRRLLQRVGSHHWVLLRVSCIKTHVQSVRRFHCECRKLSGLHKGIPSMRSYLTTIRDAPRSTLDGSPIRHLLTNHG